MKTRIILPIIALIITSICATAQPADFSKKPTALPATAMSFPKYTELTLKNGLKVYVVEDHEQPIVTMRLSLFGGDYADGTKSGLGSVMSDLLTKGAGKRSALDIATALDGVGASLAASSGGDRFTVSGDVLKKHLALLTEIFADAVTRPTFPKDEMDKLITQNIANVKSQRGQAGQVASAMARKVAYGMDHPYGRKPTEESLKSITLDDIKQAHTKFFLPNNAALAITGDITADEAKKVLEKAFGNWKKGTVPTIDVPPIKSEPVGIYFVHRPSSVQSSINTVSPAMPYNDPQYEALSLCANVMGNSFGGRLNKTLRETYSYTYSPYAYLTTAPKANRFTCAADVRNSVTDSTIIVIRRELTTISSVPVSDEDLTNMKKYVVGGYLLSFENSETVANQLLFAYSTGKPVSWVKDYPNRFLAITSQQVLDAASKYVKPSQTSIVVVGNPDVLPVLRKLGTVYEYDLDLKPFKAVEKVAMSIDDLLTKHIKALGGKEKIAGVQTLVSTAKASFEAGPQQFTGTLMRKQKQVGKSCMNVDFGVFKQQMWTDGSKAWMSMMGQPAKEVTGEEAKEQFDDAILFPTVKIDPKKATIVGVKDGAIQVDVKTDGDVKTYYFDANTYLLSKVEGKRQTPRGEVTVSEKFSNYKNVEGVMLPGMVDSDLGGPTMKAEFTYEVNKPVEDTEFKP